MATMVFHQSYVTQWHSLFKLISYIAIAWTFILIFTDNWFPYCAMALFLVSAYYLSHMK